MLRPFIRYYGGKWRGAPLYPEPMHDTIIEPFAGAAGYSMWHHRRNVVLVEKYAPLAAMWRFLIGAKPADVLAIPLVEHIEELPDSVRDGARVLVRMSFANGDAWQRNHVSTAIVQYRKETGRETVFGWTRLARERVAAQVLAIKHWRIIEGDYTSAPNVEATWFIDPPYSNHAGVHYPCGSDELDFSALGAWCRERRGQVMVCEAAGATWLPFRRFATFRRTSINHREGSREVLWTNEPMGQFEMFSSLEDG